ncbi:MAG TPA: avidin/streptavidin family protein [Bradyrhizobium sp.]|nr:avidin/streptavidin family protein [Bradyrhizobium sp.]
MKKLMLALAMVFSCQTLAFAQLPGPSTWTSQRGSVLKVTSLGRGTFRGIFINRNPDIGCLGIPYPVTGTNFGVQITFTVNFARCGAVVKWQGDVSGFGMSTPWVLKRNGVTTWGFDFFGRG